MGEAKVVPIVTLLRFGLDRAIGAAVVTIPSCAYLLQSRAKIGHDHGHDEGVHNEHEGGQEGREETEGGADSAPETAEGGKETEGEADSAAETPEGGADGGNQTSESGAEKDGEGGGTSDDNGPGTGSGEPPRPDHSVYDAGQGTPDQPGDEYPKSGGHVVESGGNVEGVRFKGATSGGTKEGEGGRPEMDDTRKHIPDAKGGAKKRIESNYAKPQGPPPEDNYPNENRVRSSA